MKEIEESEILSNSNLNFELNKNSKKNENNKENEKEKILEKQLKLNNFYFFNEGIIQLKIIILGDLKVGKTTFFKKIKEYLISTKPQNNQNHNTEDSYLSELVKIGNHYINLEIFDSPNQEKYFFLIENLIKKANGIFLLYDITKIQSFKNLKNWINNLKELIDLEKIPIVFIGNKSDKENERLISLIDIVELIQKLNSSFLEISSFNIKHIKNAMEIIIGNIFNKIKKVKKNGNEILKKENSQNFFPDISYKLSSEKIYIERDKDSLIPVLHKEDFTYNHFSC
jgi:Ras-related protein Rab-11A